MNKRARMRLIGVTAIIVIVIGVILASMGSDGMSAYTTVAKAVSDPELAGQRVQIGGQVIAGSYDPTKLPMEFDIRDENDPDDSGDFLHVIYEGGVPSTFGDGVVAIVTGDLDANGTIAADEMITKCPSKYESAEGAMTPKSLRASGDSMIGKTTKLAGAVAAGSIKAVGAGDRFVIHAEGEEMPIVFAGVLPEGMKDDSSVVITGALNKDGKFEATDVAIEEVK